MPIDLMRIVQNNQQLSNSEKIKISNQNKEKKILIVDDEPYNLMATKILLEVLGLQDSSRVVETAINGQIALEKIKNEIQANEKNRFDLIFMD